MPVLTREQYEERLRAVRLLVTDVDGVLTGGGIVYGSDGWESKQFHVRDGSAMYMARDIGLHTAIITGRKSEPVARRFAELPTAAVRQGILDKVGACIEIENELGVTAEEVAFIGDDLLDLPLIERAAVGITVADGHGRLMPHVDWVTSAGGGEGALREVVDDIVDAKGLWDQVLGRYRARVENPGTEGQG